MASVSDSLYHKGCTAAENVHNPAKKNSTVKTQAMIQSYISENVIRERESEGEACGEQRRRRDEVEGT